MFPCSKASENSHVQSLRFPQKLWKIVNECRTGAVCWSPHGKSILLCYSLFRDEFMNTHTDFFKTSNITSFIRQLNLYGFRKVYNHTQRSPNKCHSDVHEFRNKCFVQGRADLLEQVTRKSAVFRSRGSPKFRRWNSDCWSTISYSDSSRNRIKIQRTDNKENEPPGYLSAEDDDSTSDSWTPTRKHKTYKRPYRSNRMMRFLPVNQIKIPEITTTAEPVSFDFKSHSFDSNSQSFDTKSQCFDTRSQSSSLDSQPLDVQSFQLKSLPPISLEQAPVERQKRRYRKRQKEECQIVSVPIRTPVEPQPCPALKNPEAYPNSIYYGIEESYDSVMSPFLKEESADVMLSSGAFGHHVSNVECLEIKDASKRRTVHERSWVSRVPLNISLVPQLPYPNLPAHYLHLNHNPKHLYCIE